MLKSGAEEVIVVVLIHFCRFLHDPPLIMNNGGKKRTKRKGQSRPYPVRFLTLRKNLHGSAHSNTSAFFRLQSLNVGVYFRSFLVRRQSRV